MSTVTVNIGRPQVGEYAPFYEKYVSKVEGNDILTTLDEGRRKTLLLLSGRTEKDGDIRYAPEKWSVKEVIGHVCDAERVFAYRAMRIARNDATPLASFDENEFVKNAPFSHMPLSELIEDYIAVRRATLTLLRNLDETAWTRRGTASNNPVTVRGLAYIIAGHELHHRRMLEEKYFRQS